MARGQKLRSLPSDRAVDGVLHLALSPGRMAPDAPGSRRRLDSLLRELARAVPRLPPQELEELIWAHWISHRDPDAEATLAAAVHAMAAGAADLARPMLDRLVADYPDWAEAWNKRAVLSFIENRDGDAIADIAHVLRLEPRHFGAIAGFGQICLRNDMVPEARAAFQIALSINPHLEGLREIVEELREAVPTLH